MDPSDAGVQEEQGGAEEKQAQEGCSISGSDAAVTLSPFLALIHCPGPT